jgi:hypothetical protein
LDYTISCLEDMPLYEKCQKTLVVDGRTNYIPMGFDVVNVPRIKKQFSWANMWDAGVFTAKYPIVVYLDSDRMLPKSFLEKAAEVKDNQFMFTSKHFHMMKDMEIDDCKEFLVENLSKGVFMKDEFLGCFRYEPRFQEPVYGPGKNVMSGSVVFTKKTYIQSGGVDPWYRGHGAFADTDYHMQVAKMGCEFIDLDLPEIHYHHFKIDQKGDEIDELTLQRMGLDNFIYYCKKWQLPLILAEDLAVRCKIPNPWKYVEEKFRSIAME